MKRLDFTPLTDIHVSSNFSRGIFFVSRRPARLFMDTSRWSTLDPHRTLNILSRTTHELFLQSVKRVLALFGGSIIHLRYRFDVINPPDAQIRELSPINSDLSSNVVSGTRLLPTPPHHSQGKSVNSRLSVWFETLPRTSVPGKLIHNFLSLSLNLAIDMLGGFPAMMSVDISDFS
jgi:hypothetical protein